MKSIRLISILLVAVMLCGLMTSCAGGGKQEDTGTGAPAGTTAPVQSGEPTAEQTTEETSPEPTTAEETAAPVTEIPKSLKILAIGNSFSTDSMEYLWNVLRDAGVETVVLGNLYYGGCAMSQHLSFGTSDSASYTYYKNTSGSWTSRSSAKMSEAIADEEWDIITIQESSKTSGVASAYKASFKKLVDLVREKNQTATLVWNMTWAYQSDSTHSSFPNYDRDQMKMYTMITDCVKNYVMKDDRIAYFIPVGTAVQNARSSFIGDCITRDGYHLNMQFGRYLAALCWACKITGVSPDAISYNPSHSAINDDMLAVARESVANALSEPLAVTQSKITTGTSTLGGGNAIDPSVILNPADFYEQDKRIAASNGADLDKYTLLEWEHLNNTYWNCTSRAGTVVPSSTQSTYNQNVCSKQKYSLDELPLGTIFICDTGWQYRVEIYTDKDSKYGGTRKGMQSMEFFTLTQAFLGDAKYVAWNIASSPKADISKIFDQAAVHVRVYLPKG